MFAEGDDLVSTFSYEYYVDLGKMLRQLEQRDGQFVDEVKAITMHCAEEGCVIYDFNDKSYDGGRESGIGEREFQCVV